MTHKCYKKGDIVGIHEVIECLTPNLPPWRQLYQTRCTKCGKEQQHMLNSRNRNTCSCGRTYNRTHGGTKTPLYRHYRAMKERCYNPHYHHYSRYGGRGICICPEWKNNFQRFAEWAIQNGYKDNLSIDRIDNDGNYCPENCRWVTQREQILNSSRTIKTEDNKPLSVLVEQNDKKAIREYGLTIWRELIKTRAKETCEICGKKGTDAHHWFFTRAQHSLTDIQPSNGVFLCRCCHTKAHAEPEKYKNIVKAIKGSRFNNLVESSLQKNRACVSSCEQYARVIKEMIRELKRRKQNDRNV